VNNPSTTTTARRVRSILFIDLFLSLMEATLAWLCKDAMWKLCGNNELCRGRDPAAAPHQTAGLCKALEI
jgi:hypothetical protein